jgi:hypothetical protein
MRWDAFEETRRTTTTTTTTTIPLPLELAFLGLIYDDTEAARGYNTTVT